MELMNKIYNRLSAEGFTRDFAIKAFPRLANEDITTVSQFSVTKDNKGEYRIKQTKFGSYNAMYGYELYVKEVCKHNGTEKNVNVDICIYHMEDSNGVKIESEYPTTVRIKHTDSEKVFEKRIATILKSWDEITK